MSAIKDLIEQIDNLELRDRIQQEVDRISKQKKFGLVFEEHLPENVILYDVPVRRGKRVSFRNPADGEKNKVWTVLKVDSDTAICISGEEKEPEAIPVKDLVVVAEFGEPIYPYLKPIDTVCSAPDNELWHTLIEADNYHALQLLEYLYAGKVDCIYIDPPYNTGARDWKYNNNYVDSADSYRHSKWLSMMQKRLAIAKRLLDPKESVLIVTIDEKEYLHLGCLLEQMFPEARIQMISTVINSAGVAKQDRFSRTNEFIFCLMFGRCTPTALALDQEWLGNIKVDKDEVGLYWNQLMRSGSSPLRKDHPLAFYPIIVNEEGNKIIEVGECLPSGEDRSTIKPAPGTRVIWPIRSSGEEGRWQLGREKLLYAISHGYVRLGRFTKTGMAITYLAQGEQNKVESGVFEIIGHRKDGSIIEKKIVKSHNFIPGTQWNIQSHNATYFGTQLLKKIIGNRFSYPKSLYAVRDTLRFFLANKPNALVLDFFAGSGTTLHAVNLLNHEDDGHRRCIMVTNNEVSNEEEEQLEARRLKRGDEEWEQYGIARYVTWPRTKCAIEGNDIMGNPLKGEYIGTNLSMSEGFPTNAIFFKLGFLDKNEVAFGRQFKNLLPVLWMKAGARGPCPKLSEEHIPPYMVLPGNHMAILARDTSYVDFKAELEKNKEIDTVYLITDSDSDYRAMIRDLGIETSYQIYRDYLDNFRINIKR